MDSLYLNRFFCTFFTSQSSLTERSGFELNTSNWVWLTNCHDHTCCRSSSFKGLKFVRFFTGKWNFQKHKFVQKYLNPWPESQATIASWSLTTAAQRFERGWYIWWPRYFHSWKKVYFIIHKKCLWNFFFKSKTNLIAMLIVTGPNHDFVRAVGCIHALFLCTFGRLSRANVFIPGQLN